MSTWWILQPCGRLRWHEVVDALHGCTCVWMDLDALHIGEPPTEPPVATHLWGWSRQQRRYLRVRLDHDEAYLGILHENPADDSIGTAVQVTQRAALMAHHDLTGAPGLPDDNRLDVELLEIPGPAPVTFVRDAARN